MKEKLAKHFETDDYKKEMYEKIDKSDVVQLELMNKRLD